MSLDRITNNNLYRAYLVMELLRSTGEREFPLQLASVFFWIAAHNGCKQEDLVKNCSMSASSVSRCVTWLGPRHRLEHRSGLKLVRRERDPDNYKAWRLFLTPKGEVFTNLLDNHAGAPIRDGNPIYTQAKEALDAADQDLG